MSIGELVEDIIGPLNVIEHAIGILRGVGYGDMGYTFQIQRMDKGGKHSMPEIAAILKERGVVVYWFGFSGQHITFRVKNRQAKWGEYILLRAGVELLNPAFDHRNMTWAGQAKHEGKPVPSWTQQAKGCKEAKRHQSRGWLDTITKGIFG